MKEKRVRGEGDGAREERGMIRERARENRGEPEFVE